MPHHHKMIHHHWSALCFVLVAVASVLVTGTISPSDKRKVKTREIKINVGPLDETVFERNLVDKHPRAKDIITENGAYYKDTHSRAFNSTVLGYISPVSYNHQFNQFKYYIIIYHIVHSGTRVVTKYRPIVKENSTF